MAIPNRNVLLIGAGLVALSITYAFSIRWPESAHWVASALGTLAAGVTCLAGIWIWHAPRAQRLPIVAALIVGGGYLLVSLGPLSWLESQLLTTKLLASVETQLAANSPAASPEVQYWADLNAGRINIHGSRLVYAGVDPTSRVWTSSGSGGGPLILTHPASISAPISPLRVLGHLSIAWSLAIVVGGLIVWHTKSPEAAQ